MNDVTVVYFTEHASSVIEVEKYLKAHYKGR